MTKDILRDYWKRTSTIEADPEVLDNNTNKGLLASLKSYDEMRTRGWDPPQVVLFHLGELIRALEYIKK